MANIYTIRDNVCKCDCFVFLESSDGAAKTYFNAWLHIQSHVDFELIRIANIEFVEYGHESDCYKITHMDDREILLKGIDIEHLMNKDNVNG